MGKNKILIIEDDADFVRLLAMLLRANDYEVLVASDAIAAIGAAKNDKPDLILLDIGLPVGDGFSVMERISKTPCLYRIPIIIISALDPAVNKDRAIKAGARAYFQKPADNDELFAAIRQALLPRILLVEDDPQDVLLLKAALAASAVEFDITHVTRLADAVDKIRTEQFHLVLLDLSLPDSDGLDTVVGLCSASGTAPVVVLTSLADESLAARALRAGAQDYLIKGVADGAMLARTIRYAVERHRLVNQLETANKQIADFTAMMIHDLRSPLVNVIAIGDTINDGLFGPLNDEQKKWLGRIVTSGHKLVTQVSNFLDLSKLETGHIDVIKKPANLEQLLSATLDNYQLLAQQRQITLRNNIAAAYGTVEVDLDRLEQVLTNLLSNALKFTPAGGAIELGAARASNEARVWVKDSGPGIPAYEIGQLFEKYKQTSSGENSTEPGSGLGLLICKMIVEAHGGQIWVESEEHKGTTFTFTIPTGA